MIRAAVAAASAIVSGGYEVVIDGVVGPWLLHIVHEELERTDVAVGYVVLRPDLATCLARASGRALDERVPGHPPLTAAEPIRHMWQQFADLGRHERHVLDTGGLTALETAHFVAEELPSGRFDLL